MQLVTSPSFLYLYPPNAKHRLPLRFQLLKNTKRYGMFHLLTPTFCLCFARPHLHFIIRLTIMRFRPTLFQLLKNTIKYWNWLWIPATFNSCKWLSSTLFVLSSCLSANYIYSHTYIPSAPDTPPLKYPTLYKLTFKLIMDCYFWRWSSGRTQTFFIAFYPLYIVPLSLSSRNANFCHFAQVITYALST